MGTIQTFYPRYRNALTRSEMADVAVGVRELYDRAAIPADSFARTMVFAMSQPEVDINKIPCRPTAQEY